MPKQPFETKEQRKAFEFYFRLDRPSKSAVARKFKRNISTVNAWAKKFKWDKKIIERNEKTDEILKVRIAEASAEMTERHLKAAKKCVERGLENLEQKALVKPRDAIAAIKVGVDVERITRGEVTERVDTGGSTVTLDDLRGAFKDVMESRKKKIEKEK